MHPKHLATNNAANIAHYTNAHKHVKRFNSHIKNNSINSYNHHYNHHNNHHNHKHHHAATTTAATAKTPPLPASIFV